MWQKVEKWLTVKGICSINIDNVTVYNIKPTLFFPTIRILSSELDVCLVYSIALMETEMYV